MFPFTATVDTIWAFVVFSMMVFDDLTAKTNNLSL